MSVPAIMHCIMGRRGQCMSWRDPRRLDREMSPIKVAPYLNGGP
jgi:hypothetical protein